MRPLSRLALSALLLVLAMAPLPRAALAQRHAALSLTITDASTGAPVAGASVTLAVGPSGVSGPSGTVLLSGLPPGAVAADVTHLGYRSVRFTVPLAAGATLSLAIPLEPQPVVLSAVEVEAETSPHGVRAQSLRDFYDRVERGVGHFITRDQIDAWNPRQMSDLFRMIPGLRMDHTDRGERPTMASRNGPQYDTRGRNRECPIQFFVDGSPYEAAGAEALYFDVRPQEVEGIEVYTGTTGLPPQFRRSNRNCGVILIWKRERM